MNRIDSRFAALKSANRKALVTFTMAFDPDYATSLAIMNALPKAGADVIELGIPFSDPMADGPVIQAAGLRALAAGASLKKILAMVAEFRRGDSNTPVILMGYYNPIYRYGVEAFSRDAVAAGVDGVILVDLPPEEELEFKPHASKAGLHFVRLIAPTTLDERLELLLGSASGFVYYISVAGITGTKSANHVELGDKVALIKQNTTLPVAVGFGVKTPEQAREVAKSADAVVVGSALITAIENNKNDPVAAISTMVKQLAEAIKS